MKKKEEENERSENDNNGTKVLTKAFTTFLQQTAILGTSTPTSTTPITSKMLLSAEIEQQLVEVREKIERLESGVLNKSNFLILETLKKWLNLLINKLNKTQKREFGF